MKAATIELNEVEVAVLDPAGTIVGVNQAWTDFCTANDGDVTGCCLGTSYLAVCDAATDRTSQQIVDALRAILVGDQLTAVTFTIPCDGPEGDRWYDLCIAPRFGESAQTIGATVQLWRVSRPPAGRSGIRRLPIAPGRDGEWDLIEAFPDGTVLVDQFGLITHTNRQLEELTGYNRSFLLGQPIEMLLPEEFRSRHQSWTQGYRDAPRVRAMGGGVPLQLRRSDATELSVEISLAPVTLGDQPMTMASVRDVTAQRAADRSRRRLELLEDRQRIARDLHDTVIQALIGIGLQLGPAGNESVIDQLDEAIMRLRLVVFDTHEGRAGELVAETMQHVLTGGARTLGHSPTFLVRGDAERLSSEVVNHLVPVLREALSNVARHARASATGVSLVVGADVVELVVEDNGVGLRGAVPGSGTTNFGERAAMLGGSVTLLPGRDGGTVLRWTAPVGAPDP